LALRGALSRCGIGIPARVYTLPEPPKSEIVTRNTNEMSQFWPWGALVQDMIPQMKTVLALGSPGPVTANEIG
jgi:hypothetical protein